MLKLVFTIRWIILSFIILILTTKSDAKILFFSFRLQIIDDSASMVCSIADPEPDNDDDDELEPVLKSKKKWVKWSIELQFG